MGLEDESWASGAGFLLEAGIYTLRLEFERRGWELGFVAGILALKLGFRIEAGL